MRSRSSRRDSPRWPTTRAADDLDASAAYAEQARAGPAGGVQSPAHRGGAGFVSGLIPLASMAGRLLILRELRHPATIYPPET